jgi:hypothetical protein
MGDLYLFGTVHTDPDGAFRLGSALEFVSPDKIFIEISEDRTHALFANTLEDKMREHEENIASWEEQGFTLTPDQRTRLLEIARFKNKDYGYELTAPTNYQTVHPQTEIHYVDLAAKSAEFTNGLREAFNMPSPQLTETQKRNILAGLEHSVEAHQRSFRILAEREYGESMDSAVYMRMMAENPELLEKETRHLTPEAREAFYHVVSPERNNAIAQGIRDGHNAKVVSAGVMGAFHLYIVAGLLEDLKPNVILLNQIPVPQ